MNQVYLKTLALLFGQGRPPGMDPTLYPLLRLGRATKKAAYYDTLTVEKERARVNRGVAVIKRLRSRTGIGESGSVNVAVADKTVYSDDLAIPIRTYTPEKAREIMLFLHGGGWVVSSLDTSDYLCRCLSLRLQAKVVSVGYSLAPECPFPAALNELLAVIEWAERDGRPVAVAGSSAGANLAAAACLKSRDLGLTMPQRQLLLYPVTDISTFSSTSYTEFEGQKVGLTRAQMEWFKACYVDGNFREAPGLPYVSPLLAESLDNLPPGLVVTAGFDILREEGEAFGRRLESEGNGGKLIRAPGLVHGFLNFIDILPAANIWFEKIVKAYKNLVRLTETS